MIDFMQPADGGPAGRDRVITLEQVEAVRALFVAGKHAAADRAVRRLYKQGDWVADPGVSRAAVKVTTRAADGPDHDPLTSWCEHVYSRDGRDAVGVLNPCVLRVSISPRRTGCG